MKCLQKNPGQRFQSAADLAFNLRSDGNATSRRLATWPLVLAASVVACLAVGSFIAFRARERPRIQSASIAVLPFANGSGDPQSEFLADGMTDTIINKLAELPQLKVMSRNTMFRFKRQKSDPQDVGRQLHVGFVLTGRILKIGDRLDINTELLDVEDGTQRWGERYDRAMTDVFGLQDEIAQQISRNLELKLTGAQERRLTKRYTDDPQAYSMYLQGRFYWNQRTPASLRKAIGFFTESLQRDPHYALGYLGIADTYVVLPQYSGVSTVAAAAKATQAALKALTIDPDLAEAHATLGFTHTLLWQWREMRNLSCGGPLH